MDSLDDISQGYPTAKPYQFKFSLVVLLFWSFGSPCSSMAGHVLDPQRSWVDSSETEQNMGIADIPSYAQMAGRRRHSSVSSQSSID